MYKYTHKVKCKTLGCNAYDVELPMILLLSPEWDSQQNQWVSTDEQFTDIIDCFCGLCGNLIQDIVEIKL
jgi:hypothetical protein